MECPVNVTDPFFCPTKWQLWRQIIDLHPRGRAWQTHEEVSDVIDLSPHSQVGTFETDVSPLGVEPRVELLTVMQQFWAAFAAVGEYAHQRACQLLNEFFCESTVEQLNEWHIDYGFPDPCDPWHTLCDKVRAQGGATCEYLAAIAADRGWVLTCSDCEPQRSAVAGCTSAGCGKTCGCAANVIWVTIKLAESPAWVNPKITPAGAGRARAGASVAAPCPPEAVPLQCLIERFKPAHVKAIYIYEVA
jgi:uncharacterized protein YmfQ (DUF2313 family)